MHKFALARMIKRVALNIIVQLVDETDLEELQEVFLQITRQTHGVLTLERFHSELKSCKHSSGMKEVRCVFVASGLYPVDGWGGGGGPDMHACPAESDPNEGSQREWIWQHQHDGVLCCLPSTRTVPVGTIALRRVCDS